MSEQAIYMVNSFQFTRSSQGLSWRSDREGAIVPESNSRSHASRAAHLNAAAKHQQLAGMVIVRSPSIKA